MIVLDTRWITDSPSGIGVYAREMLTRIPRLAPDLRFHALFRAEAYRDATWRDYGLDGQENLTSSIVPCGPFSPKSQWVLPPLLKKLHTTLFHSPNYLIPYLAFQGPRRGPRKANMTCIANIHDIIPLVVKDYAPNSRTSRLKGIYRFCLRETLKRTTVITGSEATKRDLIAELHLPDALSSRIHVIFDGADSTAPCNAATPAAAGNSATSATLQPCNRGESAARILLYVGRMDPYKNVPLLVDALKEIQSLCPFPVRLRVVGPKDPRYPEAELRAAELGLSDSVEFTGFVSTEELANAYRTADLLTHPSRYEGFGLQIVEAMRAGLPVLCTDGGSQPEVAGDAAVVVPHDDPHALAAAAAALLQDPARMTDLRARGLERAPQFTWDRTARETLALYRAVLA